MTDENAEAIRQWVSGTFSVIWLLSAMAGIGLFGLQCIQWLATAVWNPYSAADFARAAVGLDPEDITWVGARIIIVWLLDKPLSLWLIIAPGLLLLLASFLAEDHIKERRLAAELED
jgi:hypothetical protein